MDRRTGDSSDDAATPDEVTVDNDLTTDAVDETTDDATVEAEQGDGSVPEEALVDRVRANRPARKSTAVQPKGAPTPSRGSSSALDLDDDDHHHTTPGEFVNQSVGELKKVIWPTGAEVRSHFIAVLVFVIFIMAFVVALDTGFGALLLKLFG